MAIGSAANDAARPPKPTIAPIPAIHAQLARIVEAFDEGWDAVYREADRLKEIQRDSRVLIQQWALFVTRQRDHVKGSRALGLRDILAFDEKAVVYSLAPYLYSDDPELHDIVRRQFDRADGVAPNQVTAINRPNYDHYRDYIAHRVGRGEAIPEPFAGYIYKKDPGLALLAFLHGHGGPDPRQKEVLWAEHVVSNAIWRMENGFEEAFQQIKPEAIAQLNMLSKHEEWLVRLYAAEILRRHPELRTDAMVERIKSDDNYLVREIYAHPGPKRE